MTDTTRPNPTHETGAYKGDPQVEVLERVRRIETRMTAVLRAMGVTPGARLPASVRSRAIYHDGAVYCTSNSVTLGEVASAAVLGCKGESVNVPIFLGDLRLGSIDVNGKTFGAAQ